MKGLRSVGLSLLPLFLLAATDEGKVNRAEDSALAWWVMQVPLIVFLAVIWYAIKFYRKRNRLRLRTLRQNIEKSGHSIYEGASGDLLELLARLEAVGVKPSATDRNEQLEKMLKGHWIRNRKLRGSLRIDDGPIRWITCLYKPRGKNDPPRWWTLFVILDDRLTTATQKLKIRTIRRKSRPVIGEIIDTTWKGNDHGIGLIERLSNDASIKDLAAKVGNLNILSYSREFQGWVIELDRKFSPGDKREWEAVQHIANTLLSHPLTGAPT